MWRGEPGDGAAFATVVGSLENGTVGEERMDLEVCSRCAECEWSEKQHELRSALLAGPSAHLGIAGRGVGVKQV